MKGWFFGIFILFCNGCFSQIYVHSIHNSHEISVVIQSDTTYTSVYIGCFELQKYVCEGNVVKVNSDQLKIEKGDSLIELDFSSDRTSLLKEKGEFVLQNKEVLKIRLIRPKGIRVPKKKALVIYLTINGERIEIRSKRFERRFCHHGKWTSTFYRRLE